MKDAQRIAAAYFKLLNAIDWQDPLQVRGIREGLTKFMSNASISLTRHHKVFQGSYYSRAALDLLPSSPSASLPKGLKGQLVYEHMVPKHTYIQAPCEAAAREGTLSLEMILERLERYWHIAVVTQDEERQLRRTMPATWDGRDIFARYTQAGITLIPGAFPGGDG